jgi:hypothetical protein
MTWAPLHLTHGQSTASYICKDRERMTCDERERERERVVTNASVLGKGVFSSCCSYPPWWSTDTQIPWRSKASSNPLAIIPGQHIWSSSSLPFGSFLYSTMPSPRKDLALRSCLFPALLLIASACICAHDASLSLFYCIAITVGQGQDRHEKATGATYLDRMYVDPFEH